MIEKVLFLIENRHFLIRKCHFGILGGTYVGSCQFRRTPLHLSGDTPMIRRKLLIATAIVASVVLTACSDMTGPKSTVCPVTSGSQTCLAQ
jgi:hypothetical protein